ncbi:flavodoxin [Chloropicon primus]|uniref:Flavodoxin n=1 Tax=Chloropicon primus TaxID=1764295 RepID=A0A5B8MWB0_9CHLO|nr:flavodoxin [Chloropicon primus]UPR04063.1 flavodoxin [Chloropicon primus]|mmetsp:Transcript_5343/g.16146  ORF Transcript_5343/g.16146 Transcript_5343/m.16146 type:complete len:206 (-) Transcript_5343:211-828(-)|eukprot:QDZ24853.1 flavodoxin [Chloropicon primus]
MKAAMLTKSTFAGARLAIKAASRRSASMRIGARAEVGLFYSTSTGNTEAAADWISQKFEGDISDPTDIGEIDVDDLTEYSSLIVGAPTWNTGADEGRSGTAWDEVLDEIKDLDLSGKKVAVFGCGDSSSYGDYFCDAIEEVYSAMKSAGATMVGSVATDGYDFSESKSVIDGKFCGLPLDEDNESDMTEDRIAAWCAQISGEGLA